MEWINPMYLDTGVVKDIRAQFKEESEIQLQEFLLVNFCSVTVLELTSQHSRHQLSCPVNILVFLFGRNIFMCTCICCS